jgi:GT2 family glycosyltransferase
MTTGSTAVPSAGPAGTWCGELELAGEPRVTGVTDPAHATDARLLVRLHGEPLGYLTVPLPAEGLDVPRTALLAHARFADRVAAHLAAEGLAPIEVAGQPPATDRCPNRVTGGPFVSVVVCTRDRSAILRRCLDRLRALTYPSLEIVVVDNAPSDDSTERVVADVRAVDNRFRYVREPRPGLSSARNRGLAEAGGAWVAYTDDDVDVDPQWVQGIVRGIRRRPDAGCVTGLVATASITGDAERYFDARAASWSSRCEPQEFDLRGTGAPNALYPYSPGIFGTGANFAFDRAMLVELGTFDEALGAGTPTRGGEDLDIFVRVLRAGRAIVYEPAAVVWHHHRADHEALLRQLYGYGTGLSAFVTKCLTQPGTRGEVLRRIPLGVWRMAAINAQTTERLGSSPDGAPAAKPPGALRREFAGFLAGPMLYLRARRAAGPAPRTATPA